MEAVVCTRYGPPEVLRLAEVRTPEPRAGEVRIRVGATAVTSSDTYIRGLRLPLATRLLARLALGVRAPRQPILGMVVAGTVDTVGSGVTTFMPGDRVFGMNTTRFGAYAEWVCWPAEGTLTTSPARLTDEEAVALPYGGLLALHFLRSAGLAAGRRMLVYGASGAVGTFAVQFGCHVGAEVVGACGPANLEFVASLGASRVLDYTRDDIASSGRYDVIFDAVGKRRSRLALRDAAGALLPGGKSISVDDGRPRLRAEDLVLIRKLAESGELRPVIDRTYPLEEIVEAHRYVDSGHKRGNVVVTVRPR